MLAHNNCIKTQHAVVSYYSTENNLPECNKESKTTVSFHWSFLHGWFKVDAGIELMTLL